MTRTRLPAALLALLLLLPASGRAEGWLDGVNRAVFAANTALAQGAARLASHWPEAARLPPAWREAGANLVLNTLNEPLTAISHGIAGHGDAALTSLRRFGVNLTQGYGGLVDRATQLGITVPPLDIGLALCLRGVPEGPFLMLPIMGPRTLRDGIADLVVTNALIYAALTPLVGVTPSGWTVLAILVVDEVLTLILARQIDPGPPLEAGFETLRDGYLAGRARRCADAAAG